MVQVESPKTPLEEILGSWFVYIALEIAKNSTNILRSGQDLSGNTFWEFRDALNANRNRRIVKYNPKAHYGDVKITRMDFSTTARGG